MTAGKRGYQPNPDYTQEDWDEVSDNPEWTAEDFKKARPFKEVFPELYEFVEADARRPEGADEAARQPAARPGRDRPFQGAGRGMADAHQQGVAQGDGRRQRSEVGLDRTRASGLR